MNNYTNLDKILHRQFLSENNISRFMYQRLLKDGNKCKQHVNLNHVFITGLARSGTTILLNKLYESSELTSFTYNHMPFILSPNLAKTFNKIRSNKNNSSFERYHKDGIYINSSSPECLDEIFWIRSSDNYFKNNVLYPYKISEEIINGYSYLLKRFCDSMGTQRMVIKNNNNHIRIIDLAKSFKNSYFFLIFRDPIHQAKSLLNQHLNFLNIQQKDPFVLEYMNLIGHREFGMNAIPFVYPIDSDKWYLNYNLNSLNYWILQWIHTYEWLIESKLDFDNVFFISYEKMCSDNLFYSKLCELINIKEHSSSVILETSNNHEIDFTKILSKKLIYRAMKIYKYLSEKSMF